MTTAHVYRGYVFIIEYEPKDPAYIVDFPDFANIVTSGSALPEAFAHACEALDLHLESLQKLGLAAPEPRYRLVLETVDSA